VRIADKTVEIFHKGQRTRATPVRPTGAATRGLPITCRAPIAATASGRREG
jgi:hypothetical protein